MSGVEIVSQFLKDLIAFSTLIGLATLGELLNEKVGVLNLSIDGALWIGALMTFITAYFTGSITIAILVAIGSSLSIYLLFGYMTLVKNVDQVYTGVAINLICYGVCFYIYRSIFEWGIRDASPHINVSLSDIEIPYLSQIPIIGYMLFRQTILTYLFLFLIIPLIYFIIKKTIIGIIIKAIGEDPEKAETLGINVNRYRFIILMNAGILTGISSTMFVLYFSNVYLTEMVAGRGFIAIALIILGKWELIPTILACLFYSSLEALQYRVITLISGLFPYQFILMLPYLATIIALGAVGRKVKPPASLGKTRTRTK